MWLRLAQGLAWRIYQIALFFLGLFLFWTIFGEAETPYWFWKILASFIFAFFAGFLSTILTVRAIDRFRYVTRDKSLDYLP